MMDTQIDQNYENFLMAADALVENLACSEPIVAYQSARGRLDADHPAQGKLKRLGQLQSEIRAGQARNSITQTDIECLRTLQREVQSDPTISNYAATQQAAVAYLREINQEISQLLGIDFATLARPTGGCC
ncbi:MAG: hypothetical protein H6Q37_594 [Chloroflexi bacterium]|nr:hypothetical protein [Chloroflexota bacterium]